MRSNPTAVMHPPGRTCKYRYITADGKEMRWKQQTESQRRSRKNRAHLPTPNLQNFQFHNPKTWFLIIKRACYHSRKISTFLGGNPFFVVAGLYELRSTSSSSPSSPFFLCLWVLRINLFPLCIISSKDGAFWALIFTWIVLCKTTQRCFGNWNLCRNRGFFFVWWILLRFGWNVVKKLNLLDGAFWGLILAWIVFCKTNQRCFGSWNSCRNHGFFFVWWILLRFGRNVVKNWIFF